MKKLSIDKDLIMDYIGDYTCDEIVNIMFDRIGKLVRAYELLDKHKLISDDGVDLFWDWINCEWMDRWDDYLYDILSDIIKPFKFYFHFDKETNLIYLLIFSNDNYQTYLKKEKTIYDIWLSDLMNNKWDDYNNLWLEDLKNIVID